MNNQDIINILIGLLSGIFGFLLNQVWSTVKDLQQADTSLATKVSEIEVLVAGNYVHKSELIVISEALFKKLDKIEDKLDKKLDK